MKKSLLSGSMAVLAALIICKLTAFLQETIIAAYLGATAIGDAFNTVNGIQETVFPMLAVGINQVFLPAYKSVLVHENRKKADLLANYAIVFFTAISVVVVILLLAFAPFVVRLVAPGFDDNQRQLTAHLVRLSASSYIFTCCAGVMSSMLVADGKLFASEIRGAFTHLPVIAAALFFYNSFGLDALAVSLVVAGLVRLAVLLPFMHDGYRFTIKEPLQWEYVRALLSRLPSSLISSGITQLNTLVDKIMASKLAVGSISCLNYGARVYMVLQELLTKGIALSSYPQIIELIARNKIEELSKMLSRIVCIIWFFTIPLTIGGIVYSNNVINIVYVRGAFSEEMGLITAGAFAGYVTALAFSSLNGIMNNVYFGFGDTKSPMRFNLLNLILNICLNILLVKKLAVAGLAVATAISSIICLVTRIIFIRKKLSLQLSKIAKQGLIILASSLIAVGSSYFLIQFIGLSGNIKVLACAVVVSVSIYFIEMRIIKLPVYEDASQVIRDLISKRTEKNEM